jgi:hypothetical protein
MALKEIIEIPPLTAMQYREILSATEGGKDRAKEGNRKR